MVLPHTIASTGVLGTSDGLGESGIDDVGVELTDGHFGFDEMVRAGRVGKHDGAVGVGRVRGQAEESVDEASTQRWSKTGQHVKAKRRADRRGLAHRCR